MKIKITGKELKITDAINDYAEKKMERIEKYFDNAEAEIIAKVEKNYQIAEIKVMANGETFRAVAEEKDLYASIDKDIDIIEGQIRKAKTKREKMQKDSSLKDLNAQTIVHEVEDEILKVEYYEIKPMTPEDAKLKLEERPSQMFLTFVNQENGKVNVIHRLKDGKNFGLIEQIKDYINDEKIQFFVVDSIDEETWPSDGDKQLKSNRQEQYVNYSPLKKMGASCFIDRCL